MGETVRFNKDALIDELKQIHKDMVSVYKELFTYKYKNNEDFRDFIEKEYRENGIGNDGKEKWNENFCHRTSYTLINKVLFIRICEDKGFMFNPEEDFIMGEPKDPNIGKKLSARGRDRWISLISNYTFGELLKFAFADMKESFKNIALFKEDKYEKLNPTKQELELKFMLDSKEYKKTPIYSYEENVAKIIEKLDTSKFDFNVPAEGNILGDVYEKFMDRETRKAIGQFYTPDFVIEYILNNTVAEADVVENPFVSVLDPACGSGHFLIMAYDILRKKFEESIDKLREKYADVDYVYKNEKMKGKEYWVKDRIHYHILKHCIFGADIDSFAVQLTTINLLLKDLDNFTDELNIMECDSLIKWEEDYDWQDLKRQLEDHNKLYYTINYKDIAGIQRQGILSWDKAEELVRLCEFWSKKYDYVVGNPPYITVGGKFTELLEGKYEEYLLNKYTYSIYKMNTYILFYERSLATVKSNGVISFITPRAILDNYYFKSFREFILNYFIINSVLEINDKVFDMAEVGGNAIICIMKSHEKVDNYLITTGRIVDIKQLNNLENYLFKVSVVTFKNNPNYSFLISTNEQIEIVHKIKNNNLLLSDVCIFKNGVNTGNSANILLSKVKKDDRYLPIIEGKDINRFNIKWGGLYICYDPSLKKKIDLNQLKTKQKKIDFSLRSIELFNTNKIVIRQTGDKLIADLDTKNFITRHSVHLVYVKEEFKYIPLMYILCLLNSEMINFYYQSIIPERGKAFAEVKIVNLQQLPIKVTNKTKIDKISEIGYKIKSLYDNYNSTMDEVDNLLINFNINKYIKHLQKKDKIYGEIGICYKIINKLIYELYELKISDIEFIKKYNNELLSFEEEKINSMPYEQINIDSIIKDSVQNLSIKLDKYKFLEEHISKNNSIEEISKKYGFEYITVTMLREKYAKEHAENEQWKFYNLSELYILVNEHIKNRVIEVIKENTKYMSIDDIRDKLEEIYNNFEELMNIMRKDNPTKKSKDIVKEALNQFADTWNSYIKNINAGKEPKELVKYYDSNYYGLSEWDDEVHKEYFIDAIKEYTEINPNEKKARDILKLFEGLNIKDKEDYIEVLSSQIKKAFRR